MRTTLVDFDPDALAAAFNAVCDGYVQPFAMSADDALRHVRSTAIDLRRSPLWLDDAGAIQAMAALGIK